MALLNPLPNPTELDAMRAVAAAKKPLPSDAIPRAAELFDWLAHWRTSKGYKPVQLDCIEQLGRKPDGLRQQFYNARSHLKTYPEVEVALRSQYGDEEFALNKDALLNCNLSIVAERFLVVTKLRGGGLIAATSDYAPQVVSLRTRFENWLAGDMAQAFIATEALTKDDLSYFEFKSMELAAIGVRVEATANGVKAGRLV